MSWLAALVEDIDRHGAVVRVTVVRVDGSAPREVGAAMVVGADRVDGTVGGGALELAAIGHARRMLADGASRSNLWRREVRDFPLGPSLGQCCGGYTQLLLEVFGASERQHVAPLGQDCDVQHGLLVRPLASGLPPCVAADRKVRHPGWPLPVVRAIREMLSGARPRAPLLVRAAKGEPAWFIEPIARPLHRLYIYGAGHVGRAIVRVLEDLPFAVTWVDTAAPRFPERIPPHARAEIAADPAAFAASTEAGAFHLVLTCSHALDLAICHRLLGRGDFRFLGLIGSATKRARFLKRLADLGIGEAQLRRVTCPIGLLGVGSKEPAAIAVSVAAQLLQLATAHEGSDSRRETDCGIPGQ